MQSTQQKKACNVLAVNNDCFVHFVFYYQGHILPNGRQGSNSPETSAFALFLLLFVHGVR
jgi:hypothetical protein